MTFLPIVERELRLAARRKSTHWIRFATGLAAVIIGGMSFLLTVLSARMGTGLFPGLSGGFVFSVLSYYLFGICLLAGVFSGGRFPERRTAGRHAGAFVSHGLEGIRCGSGEVAGGVVERVLRVAGRVSDSGPEPGGGGVEGAEFWRMCLALLNALWVSTTIALWAS